MVYPGLLLQERYRVVERLGIGGQCETWLVDDRGTKKVVKVLLDNYEKFVELFQREAKVLSQLRHPGIPKVDPDGYFIAVPEVKEQENSSPTPSSAVTKTIETPDECRTKTMVNPLPDSQKQKGQLHCMAMEFIEGEDLKKWLENRQNKPISQKQAIDWLKQLVEILAKIHEQKYFHRDIKPSNIMRRPDGQLVLIDFGAVREITATFIEKRKTQDITRVYSQGYTAPEQLSGEAIEQSDFFALGRTFVYLLTGKEPGEFQEDKNTFQLQLDWRSSAPRVSKPLADLIDELMAPSPENRPENAQDILQRLTIVYLESSVRSHLKDLPQPLKFLAEPILKHQIKLWVRNNRVPKIGLYGRAGSGKSSLINAILAKRVANVDDVKPVIIAPTPYNYARHGWQLTFIDSRGVGDSPSEEASEQAINYIVKEGLDILLFVIPANDRAVGSDYNFLRDIKAAHQNKHGTELPVMLVINKIDLMPPFREWNPPYNLNLDSQSASKPKEAKIRECIQFRVEQYKELTKLYVPVCTLWNDGEDARYNIDELALKIYDCIPDEAKPGFAGAAAATSVKKALASTLTGALAAAASSICFMPIPVLDAIALFYIQVKLVSIIAQIASDNQDQKETATNFINYLGLYEIGGANVLVNQIAKLIPGIGFALNAGAATTVAALTMILGRVAVGHFIDGISMEEAKQKYHELNARDREKFLEAFMGH